MGDFLERDFFGNEPGGGGPAAPTWVPEYDNDWRLEPAPIDLKTVGFTYTDRFGAVWSVNAPGEPTAWTLTPAVGIRFLGPGLVGAQIPMLYLTIQGLVDLGTGPAYTWRDRIFIVNHWADFSHAVAGASMLAVYSQYFASYGGRNYASVTARGYIPGVVNDGVNLGLLGDWEGPYTWGNAKAEACTNWYEGFEEMGWGIFVNSYEPVGALPFPVNPTPLTRAYNNDNVHEIRPIKQWRDPDGIGDNTPVLYLGCSMGVGQAFDAKLIRTAVYRWRVP